MVETLVDLVDVSAARDSQASKRPLDRFVDDALEIASAALHLVDQVGWDVEGLAHVIQKRLASFLNHASIEVVCRTALLFGKDYLRQGHLRQVLPRLAVDDLDLVPIAHEVGDAFERYVVAGASVIKLAIRILLDKVSFGGSRHGSPILTRCVIQADRRVDGGLCMAAKKRASTRSKLLRRAVKAGRSAIREANKRVPPDVRKQIERTVQDGQKTFHTAIKQVQTRLDRTARQADLDKAMKRLDNLAKQVRKIAAGTVASSNSRPARRKPATRRAATRKPAARKPAARKTAARKPAAKRTTARRTTSRPTQPATPSPTPEPGEMDGA